MWSSWCHITTETSGHECYEPLLRNSVVEIKTEHLEILPQAKHEEWRIPSFYMLPKIHKNLENPPGRPIIRGNESLAEPASKFHDFHIKPFMFDLSFIQDSITWKPWGTPDHHFFGTTDVESLCTNINHKEGLQALLHYLEKRELAQTPPAAFILTLNNYVFLFQNELCE